MRDVWLGRRENQVAIQPDKLGKAAQGLQRSLAFAVASGWPRTLALDEPPDGLLSFAEECAQPRRMALGGEQGGLA